LYSSSASFPIAKPAINTKQTLLGFKKLHLSLLLGMLFVVPAEGAIRGARKHNLLGAIYL